MSFRPMVRIVNDGMAGNGTRVIEPLSGNAIPNVRKVTWEARANGLSIATNELMATIDVRAEGTFVVNPQEVPEPEPKGQTVNVDVPVKEIATEVARMIAEADATLSAR